MARLTPAPPDDARIRMARDDDAAALHAIYAPVVTGSAISFEYEPPDVGEMRRRLRAILEVAPWIVCESGGQVLGYAYACRYRPRAAYTWTAETTVYVGEAARGRRVASALYDALLAGLCLQGFRTTVAVITLPNPASVALHRRFGFAPMGVLPQSGFKAGRWHPTSFWHHQCRCTGPPGAPPVSPRALESDPSWSRAVVTAQQRILPITD